jgi:hypothetical protein
MQLRHKRPRPLNFRGQRIGFAIWLQGCFPFAVQQTNKRGRAKPRNRATHT